MIRLRAVGGSCRHQFSALFDSRPVAHSTTWGFSALPHAAFGDVRLPSGPPQCAPTGAFVPPTRELLTGRRPIQLDGTCRVSREVILDGVVPRGTNVIEVRDGFRHYGPNLCGPDWQNHGTAALPESRPEDLPFRKTPCARWREWEWKAQCVYLEVSVRFQLVDPIWARLCIEFNAMKL